MKYSPIFMILTMKQLDVYAVSRAKAFERLSAGQQEYIILNLLTSDYPTLLDEIVKRSRVIKPSHVVLLDIDIVPNNNLETLIGAKNFSYSENGKIIVIDCKILHRFGSFKHKTASRLEFVNWLVEKSKSNGFSISLLTEDLISCNFKLLCSTSTQAVETERPEAPAEQIKNAIEESIETRSFGFDTTRYGYGRRRRNS